MRKKLSILASFLLMTVQLLVAQNKTISGKVSDANGSPIAAASVTAKGTQIGTATKEDGTFTLVVPASTKALVISSIGYASTEAVLTGASLNIVLKNNVNTDAEVIVVGYGTKLKKDLTGNISRIKGTEIANTPVANFTQALQGRAAGVFVEANNGKVGEGVKVRIRGTTSITGNNAPLYVVDGVPINSDPISGNSLADLNSNDIETFDILKDASAAAIYGSRAANGVVLITTKKGRAGKTNLSVNMQYGSNMPTGYRGFLDAKEYVDLLREAAINSDKIEGVDPLDPTQYAGSWLQFAEKRLTRYSGWSDWKKLETNTNWEKLAFNQDAKTKSFDVNASGGNEKTRFYISGSYANQDGIIVGNNFSRISSRINLDHEVSSKLKVGFNLGLARTISNRVSNDNDFSTPIQLVALSPITPLRDKNGVMYDRPTTTYYNGLIELESSKYVSTIFRNIGSAYLNYKIVKDLVFKSEFGIDLQNQTDDQYSGSRSINGSATNGFGAYDGYRAFTYNTNNYFNYAKAFGDHDLDFTLGMSFQKSSAEANRVTGEDFPDDYLQTLASAGRITGGYSSKSDYSILSYFSRLNYKFNNKYLVGLSGRMDGSSVFGANNRYGFFPAVSAGWIISEEDFMKSLDWLSFLKIRASYGISGSDGVPNRFASRTLYSSSKNNNSSALVASQIGNPNLKWEKSTQLDLGIDFGVFNNRLTGEIDYYTRNTSDLFYNVPIPGTTGFASWLVNIGSMENKGLELVLNSVNITNKDFKWTTSLNVSKMENKITKLDGDQTTIPGNDGRYLNSLIVGQPIGVFYGPKFVGADKDNGDALYLKEDGKTTTNDYNEAGNFVVGNPNPDMIAGLQNTLNYKGVELSVLFQGVFGNQILNGAGGFMSASFDWFDNQTRDQLNRWQKKGDVTMVPQLRLGYGNGIGASSRYVEDGDYIRLKNVTLAYNLPKALLNRVKLSSARVYFTGVNLATFTKYSGWDPEVNTDYRASNRNQGGDFYAAPQIKSLTFGINLGL